MLHGSCLLLEPQSLQVWVLVCMYEKITVEWGRTAFQQNACEDHTATAESFIPSHDACDARRSILRGRMNVHFYELGTLSSFVCLFVLFFLARHRSLLSPRTPTRTGSVPDASSFLTSLFRRRRIPRSTLVSVSASFPMHLLVFTRTVHGGQASGTAP